MNGLGNGPNDFNLSKTTFLVADTKTQFRDMVQSALLGAGAKSVKHATSIEKAVETLNRYGQEINCVIGDWDMSPTSGLELLRMIRCRLLLKTSPRTTVVILTGHADSAAVKAALALDVNGFAVAPLSTEKLVRTVSAALTRTWILHQPPHYAAIPGVVIPHAPEPRAQVSNEAHRRADVTATAHHHPPAAPPARSRRAHAYAQSAHHPRTQKRAHVRLTRRQSRTSLGPGFARP